MRVISSFRDFYDPLMDPSDKINVWIRETKTINFDDRPLRHTYYDRYEYSRRIIGFCGEFYKYYYFQDQIYWEWEKLKPIYESYLRKVNNWKTKLYFRKKTRRQRKFSQEWGFNKINTDSYKKYFRKYQTPYFHVYTNGIVINPPLKKYEFYKIKPPPQCYQEIEAYLFGVISEAREKVPPVSDKDLLLAKGFDPKTSFRKEKRKRD